MPTNLLIKYNNLLEIDSLQEDQTSHSIQHSSECRECFYRENEPVSKRGHGDTYPIHHYSRDTREHDSCGLHLSYRLQDEN